MDLEHAVLQVQDGQEAAFEAAFEEAKAVIASATGFLSLRLEECVEHPGRYLLLVEWTSIEAHVEGFRGSPAFVEWRALLHHFYDPAPVVEHYERISEA
jgi:heme-degrading monooxygenase HmoA